MSAPSTPPPLAKTRSLRDRLGDRALLIVTTSAGILAVATLVLMVYEVFRHANLAWHEFGFGFLIHQTWDPFHLHFGALAFIFGTLLTSVGAILIATPLALAIALYLTEMAPRALREIIGALVELLAAIPSVVLGLWGILVLAPRVQSIEAPLHSALGFIPFFGPAQAYGSSVFTAMVVLTIMVVPIVASVSREVFTAVPKDLKEGAIALGATRWEMVRGVMLPTARPGIVAAVTLGFGRAIGEAIAVTQVIGSQVGIHWNWFLGGDTLASRVASEYQGASTRVQTSSLIYLGAILLVFSLLVNILAQIIARSTGAGSRRRGIRRGFGRAFAFARGGG
ncbi:MAG: phosphate ABC transporter permease subunit PstC [Gaiellaceae bacterium]